MKKINLKNNGIVLLLLFTAWMSACAGENTYTKLKIEIPRPVEVDIQSYREIAVTDFLIKDEKPDFELNKKIVDYFREEFRVETQKNIPYLEDIPLTEKDFLDPDFWKKYSGVDEKRLILTGTASYKTETRKALIGKEKRQFSDPFPDQKRLMERNFFNILLEIYFIDPESGKVIYKRQFDEKNAVENPNQTGEYGFYDLIIQIKDKLFRQLFGKERIQQRYLIMK